MTDIKRRTPVAIDLSQKQPEKVSAVDQALEIAPRLPRAIAPINVVINPNQDFGEIELLGLEPDKSSKLWPLGTIFISAASGLATLWLSSSLYIWVETLIATKPQLGWIAAGLALLTAMALAGFLAREILAISRLSANQKLRQLLLVSKLENNLKTASDAVAGLVKIAESLPATAKGRAEFLATDREFLSASDLIVLAESDLVSPLDKIAIERVTSAAKRVSVVTAISPRAFVDIAYVLYENAKLIRAVAEIYGCRPGVFGFFRLARETLAHLAVTGVVAMGDSIVQQIVGHGVAARVSAKLGEGVLNGLMTARIGFSAMDVTRPAPFSETNRPKISQVLSVLNPVTTKQST